MKNAIDHRSQEPLKPNHCVRAGAELALALAENPHISSWSPFYMRAAWSFYECGDRERSLDAVQKHLIRANATENHAISVATRLESIPVLYANGAVTEAETILEGIDSSYDRIGGDERRAHDFRQLFARLAQVCEKTYYAKLCDQYCCEGQRQVNEEPLLPPASTPKEILQRELELLLEEALRMQYTAHELQIWIEPYVRNVPCERYPGVLARAWTQNEQYLRGPDFFFVRQYLVFAEVADLMGNRLFPAFAVRKALDLTLECHKEGILEFGVIEDLFLSYPVLSRFMYDVLQREWNEDFETIVGYDGDYFEMVKTILPSLAQYGPTKAVQSLVENLMENDSLADSFKAELLLAQAEGLSRREWPDFDQIRELYFKAEKLTEGSDVPSEAGAAAEFGRFRSQILMGLEGISIAQLRGLTKQPREYQDEFIESLCESSIDKQENLLKRLTQDIAQFPDSSLPFVDNFIELLQHSNSPRRDELLAHTAEALQDALPADELHLIHRLIDEIHNPLYRLLAYASWLSPQVLNPLPLNERITVIQTFSELCSIHLPYSYDDAGELDHEARIVTSLVEAGETELALTFCKQDAADGQVVVRYKGYLAGLSKLHSEIRTRIVIEKVLPELIKIANSCTEEIELDRMMPLPALLCDLDDSPDSLRIITNLEALDDV